MNLKHKYKKIIIFFTFFLVLITSANFVFALEVHYPTIFGLTINDNSTFADYGCYLYGLLTNLGIFISVIVLVYGGIRYMSSVFVGKAIGKGGPEESKEIIKAGIYGLLIIVCSGMLASTLNPSLKTCNIGALELINFIPSSNGGGSRGANFASYSEIPIGSLTENLLTRTIDCYGFDPEGNPISGFELSDDNDQRVMSPTYLRRDRADCLLQLMDGAQKKGQVIAELSKKIIDLMNQCKCTPDKCENTCGGQAGCDEPFNANMAADGTCSPMLPGTSAVCTGECAKWQDPYKVRCKQAKGVDDCCPEIAVDENGEQFVDKNGKPIKNNKGKPWSVKDQIEHGPIVVGKCGNNATGEDLCLDDVDCPEKQVCSEDFICEDDPACCGLPKRTYRGLDEYRCDSSTQQCYNIASLVEDTTHQYQKKTITIINIDGNQGVRTPKKWTDLTLYQQLTYYKEKISQLKTKIQQDANALAQGSFALGQCYLSTPYIDLLKIYKSTNQQEKMILVQRPFSDPVTGGAMDATKYCKGFNYANSDCLKRCNDECPDDSANAIKLYSGCGGNNDQAACVKDVYIQRPCPLGDGTYKNFEGCMSACKNDCSNLCAKKYSSCTKDYETCVNLCENNGQCVLDNTRNCLFGSKAQGFIDCTKKITDEGNAKFCLNNAYLCKNGSNQYAGYVDCVNSKDIVAGEDTCSMDKFSSSFLYENSDCLKCPSSLDPPSPKSLCFSKNQGGNQKNNDDQSACQSLCPETAKCPPSSMCPNCSCNEYDEEEIGFSVATSEGDDNYIVKEISAYQLVGPQCNKYEYNDDPLTFYCQSNWIKDPEREGNSPIPIGSERNCPLAGEVPVGQTVDNARMWANGIIGVASGASRDIQSMITNMKKIGDAYKTQPILDYCKCNAKMQSSEVICSTDCKYWQQLRKAPILDKDGNVIGEKQWWECGCQFIECDGSPCKQLIEYLQEIWSRYYSLKNSYMNFFITMVQEPRSDIMKQLNYSRQQMNTCSLVANNYGVKTRLLSCTRAEDEQISPCSDTVTFGDQNWPGYCYGQKLGGIIGVPLTDNWFCAEQHATNPTPTTKLK